MSVLGLATEVVIVGAGPSGLLASILLSKLEVSHVLVEQRQTTVKAPAAHVVNTRTLEIYRQAGINVDELYGLNSHPTAHLVTWKSTLGAEPLGVFNAAEHREPLPVPISREHTTNISQHRLEAYLLDVAQQSSFADIRFSTRWVEFSNPEKTSSTFESNGGAVEIGYRYMIAADGAASPVARSLGIRRVGPDAIATFLNLTCEVDISAVSGEDASLLYWLLDPSAQGTIIVHDPRKLAVYMRPLAVPYESINDYDDERCEELTKEVYGDVPCKIVHKGIWKMTAQVAERFRDGPVFLVGDAVHRFPPTGGLGLNTGAGDVHNLIWKLYAILKNTVAADQADALLESYELERKPVAQRNCDVSERNNGKMMEVVQALGLDPSKANVLARVMNFGLVKALPDSLRSGVFSLLTKPVRSILTGALADTEQGQQVRRRVDQSIANQKEHFSSLGLDLGYVYRKGVCVSAAASETPENSVTTYVESTGAGARFPERLMDKTSSEALHDLIDYTGFTLFRTSDAPVIDEPTFGLPVRDVALDTGYEYSPPLGIEGGGWALVRPDGHVMHSSVDT